MRFHQEGYSSIVVAGLTALGLLAIVILLFPDAAVVHYLTAGLGIVLLVAILQFFRHPARTIPPGDRLVLAPADGKVVVIEEATEPEYLKDRRIQLSIFLSPVNVHVNRCPVQGHESGGASCRESVCQYVYS